jgi:GR25 family glycosyltransferase involved in LPS biosynthesis
MDWVQRCLVAGCILMGLVVFVLWPPTNWRTSRMPPLPLPSSGSCFLSDSSMELHAVCISMEHRKASHYEVMRKDFAAEGLPLHLFAGINGKTLNLDDQPLSPAYREFFDSNARDFKAGKTETNYRGHLGATLSHIAVLREAGAREQGMTLVMEDDADIHDEFNRKLTEALKELNNLDPGWEILLLGFSSLYDHYDVHKLNDYSPVYPGGLVRVYAWIGAWAYVVRDPFVARKLVSFFNPITWHIDLVLSEQTRNGKLNVYGCMPTIADHAGLLRQSSWDHNQVGKWANGALKTDTNR